MITKYAALREIVVISLLRMKGHEGRKDSEPVMVWLLVWQASSYDACLKLVLLLSVEPSCWNERQKHGVWSTCTMLLWLSPLCQIFHKKYLPYSENVWDVRYSERLGRSSYKEQYAYYYRWAISGKGGYLMISNFLILESWKVRGLRLVLESLTNFGSFFTF